MAAASLSVLGLSIPNDNDDCSQGATGRTLEMWNNQPTIMQAAKKSSKSILHYFTSSENLLQNTPRLAPHKTKYFKKLW